MRLGKEISSGTSILSVASAVFENEPLQKKWTRAEHCSPWGHDVHLVYNNPIGEDPKPRILEASWWSKIPRCSTILLPCSGVFLSACGWGWKSEK